MLVYQGSSLKAVRQTVLEIQALESTRITYKMGETQGTPSVFRIYKCPFLYFPSVVASQQFVGQLWDYDIRDQH